MRVAKVLAVAGLVALGAGGCGGSSHGATPPTSRAPVGSTTVAGPTSTTTATVAPPSSAASTTVPPGGQCLTADLHGSFSIVPGSAGAGHVSARVVLTNVSHSTCVTGGYVGMLLLNSAGAALPTDVQRVPGPTATLHVAPGASVSAVARFSPDVAGPGDSQSGPCQPVAASTEITPPNDTAHLVVSGPGSSVCERGTLQLDPLQAGADAGPV